MYSDHTAWVIGGTSGSGLAIANHLDSEGYKVYKTGEEVDVRSAMAISNCVKRIQLSDRPIDTLVYSAGINYLEWIGRMDMGDASDVMNVNAMGFIRVLDELVPSNEEERFRRPLRVLAVSSDAAVRPLRTSIAYCASKAALDMAVKVAARELGPYGWRVNAISPGMLDDTDMTRYVDSRVQEVRNWTEPRMREYERSQEVVDGRIDTFQVAQLAHDILNGPHHLNGAIIPLNGGR